MANKITSKRNNAAKKVSHSHIRTNKVHIKLCMPYSV